MKTQFKIGIIQSQFNLLPTLTILWQQEWESKYISVEIHWLYFGIGVKWVSEFKWINE